MNGAAYDFGLSFQPRWADSPAWFQIACWALCLVPFVLTVWLYRTEMRLVRPAAARTLLALRISVLASLLCSAMLRPVVRATGVEHVRGLVLLGLDRSESMSIADPQRPLIEKLRLARTFALTNDLCSTRQLDAWIEEVAAKGQVTWPVGTAGTDSALRQAFDRVCQRIDALTRERLGAAVLADQGKLLATIESAHEARLLGFGSFAADLSRDLNQPPSSLATATNLCAPMESALGMGNEPPVAVVLLTDGQHNGEGSPVAVAARLGEQKTPVYAIVLGPREPPPDVAIRSVQAPMSAFKDSEVAVNVRVQVHGLGPRVLQLELERAGREPIVVPIRHEGGSRVHNLQIPVRVDAAGLQSMTARVRPEAEETRPDNNARTFAIQVSDEKARVLVIDGEARWEFHYLASAMARDRGAEITSVVFSQPRLQPGADDSRGDLPARRLPPGPDGLDPFDCIVLGDVTPEQLPLAERERLERWVSDRGGTLIVVAGKRAMPAAYLQSGVESDPIRKLLPISSSRVLTPSPGYSLTPTAEGRLTPFLQLESTPEDNERRWKSLPKHAWGIEGRAKPGATVLACDRDSEAESRGNPAEREKEHALIARQTVGFGRVLYMGLDSTWRYRLRVGDTYHHRLWGQILRWAASDQALIAGNAVVRFGPRKPIVPHGEDVEVAVRWLDIARPLAPGSLAAVRVLRKRDGQPDEVVGLTPLSGSEVRRRELEARLRGLAPGEYAAELVIPDRAADLLNSDGSKSPLRASFRITARESVELADLSTNIALLEEIAARSGGRVFAAEHAGQIADLLAARPSSRSTVREWKLAESWLTFALVLMLLSGEWVVRKLCGLP